MIPAGPGKNAAELCLKRPTYFPARSRNIPFAPIAKSTTLRLPGRGFEDGDLG
jgi:hypothetical protein